MLAELAAFNAGIAIVKEAINHGKDLYDAMQGISQLTVAKEDIKSKHEKAKNNPFASDAEINELFWALEKCKQEEAELQEIMTWAGRADLWTDYVTFTAEARKQRLEARKAAQKRKAEIIDLSLIIAGILSVSAFIVSLVWLFLTRG